MRRGATRVITPGQLGALPVRRGLGFNDVSTRAIIDNAPPRPIVLQSPALPPMISFPPPDTSAIATAIQQRADYLQANPPAGPQTSFIDKAKAWFSGEAFNGTGISRGAVTAGGAGLAMLAMIAGGKRR